MKTATLLAKLRRRGVELTVHGQDISYRAPKGTMSTELIDSIQQHKQQILQELLSESRQATASESVSVQAAVDSSFDRLARLAARDSDLMPFHHHHQHPYARYVEPLKSRLLEDVGLDINFVQGEGCYLWDADGNRHLDCIAQYGGLPFGYNPEDIWQALRSVESRRLPNVATQSLLDSAGELAQQLLHVLPPHFQHVVFCNSGAEATEVAIKLCRSTRQRAGILSTHDGFHGLTTGALACTGNRGFQQGFCVSTDDFDYVAYGDSAALRSVLQSAPERYAAFFVEPIQGESGIVIPPQGYLRKVRAICDQFQVLMVVDEVQTGLGRTGEMFAFQREQIIPDVLLIAKALGGGLMPIGAIACQASAYNPRFGLRHSSTMAGNACASQCGLATLARLQTDNQRLLNDVRDRGNYLLRGLVEIRAQHPQLVREVRGRGLMLAIEFDFSRLQSKAGLLPILAEQQWLLHLMVSYLLHAHRVRVAATFMGRSVLRIEPPLIISQADCDWLLTALRDVMEVIEQANSAALVAPMIGVDCRQLTPNGLAITSGSQGSPKKVEKSLADLIPLSSQCAGDFGFLVHLTDLHDLVKFDPSLNVFDREQLARLKHTLTRSSEPTVVGHCHIGSSRGTFVQGHFVLVPYTPQELMQFSSERVVEMIQQAAEVAAKLDVRLIGLGGFTSILTHGGLALQASRLPPLTSGNAYTVSTGLSAVQRMCRQREVLLANAEVAIVGAAGQIGRALTLILSEQVNRLVLVGREGSPARTKQQLHTLARDVISHLRDTGQAIQPNGPSSNRRWELETSRKLPDVRRAWTGDRTSGGLVTATSQPESRGLLAQRVDHFLQTAGWQSTSPNDSVDVSLNGAVDAIIEKLVASGKLVLAEHIDAIRTADIVLLATSAVQPIVSPQLLKQRAIVCDLSRPANVSDEVKRMRSDVAWIEGGLVRLAGCPPLGLFAGPHSDTIYACVAESALWVLEPELGLPSAVQLLQPQQVHRLGQVAKRHGFEVIVD